MSEYLPELTPDEYANKLHQAYARIRELEEKIERLRKAGDAIINDLSDEYHADDKVNWQDTKKSR